MTPTAIVLVPCAFAVMHFAKFQYKFTFSSYKCQLIRGKLLCPVKSEVQGQLVYVPLVICCLALVHIPCLLVYIPCLLVYLYTYL